MCVCVCVCVCVYMCSVVWIRLLCVRDECVGEEVNKDRYYVVERKYVCMLELLATTNSVYKNVKYYYATTGQLL